MTVASWLRSAVASLVPQRVNMMDRSKTLTALSLLRSPILPAGEGVGVGVAVALGVGVGVGVGVALDDTKAVGAGLAEKVLPTSCCQLDCQVAKLMLQAPAGMPLPVVGSLGRVPQVP